MSDWQKVRVEFTDADGNEVSFVAYWNEQYKIVDIDPYSSQGFDFEGYGYDVEVTPIRELPTGIGAVIKVNKIAWDVSGSHILVRNSGGHWVDVHGGIWLVNLDFDYEVLSEGVQL